MDRIDAAAPDWLRAMGEHLGDHGPPPGTIPVAAVLLALGLHWALFRWQLRRTQGHLGVWPRLVRRMRRPVRLAFVLAALILSVPGSGLPMEWTARLEHLALILLILLIGWVAVGLTNFFAARSIARHRFDVEDNLMARKYVTQVRVLQRAANIVLTLLTAIGAAMTFEAVQSYVTSLLASAGAAGLILGLAARPVLANLIAGIQIALTQPIRLEDVVIVEGEWGWVEEIFATYVVVRIWDWRRMVVPLSFFIEQPFQNWTRETASILGSVFWHVDYTLPVGEMRKKMHEVVEASPLWDGKAVVLQVVETDKDTVTLRGLMSSRNSPENWDLRCEVREKMVTWLQDTYPQALPRLRGELSLLPDGAGRMPGGQDGQAPDRRAREAAAQRTERRSGS